jgi:hypothetical protein
MGVALNTVIEGFQLWEATVCMIKTKKNPPTHAQSHAPIHFNIQQRKTEGTLHSIACNTHSLTAGFCLKPLEPLPSDPLDFISFEGDAESNLLSEMSASLESLEYFRNFFFFAFKERNLQMRKDREAFNARNSETMYMIKEPRPRGIYILK